MAKRVENSHLVKNFEFSPVSVFEKVLYALVKIPVEEEKLEYLQQ